MKKLLLNIILVLSTLFCFGQKTNVGLESNFIATYFSAYSNQPEFRITTMNEDMIKRSIEMGVFKNNKLAGIMKQVKTFKLLKMKAEQPESIHKILDEVEAKVKRGQLYELYYKYEKDKSTSYLIYTRGAKKVNELVIISIGKSLNVSCYLGDQIDIEAIRKLTTNQ